MEYLHVHQRVGAIGKGNILTYTAHRDERFQYVTEVIQFIEENQCEVCRFRKSPAEWDADHAVEYPMCPEIESTLIAEKPVEELDDKGSAGVVCSRFKLGDPPSPVDPDQLVLGE